MGFCEDLYEQGFFPSEDARPEDVEGVRQANAKVVELADKIIERLGDKLFDAFLSAKAEAVSFEVQTAFAQGRGLWDGYLWSVAVT